MHRDDEAGLTVTQVYQAMTECGPDCDAAWMAATLDTKYQNRRKEGAERTGLFDLTDEDRAEFVAQMRQTFGV